MSREIPDDFSNLITFLKGYNLSELGSNQSFIKILSQQHKKYFSYLTFVAELTELSKDKKLEPNISKKQLDFITESCSDVGSTIFVMSHGAYKAARLTLRSSIETFNKGFNLDFIPDLDQEKSVFVIFDKIKELDFFKGEPNKSLMNSIHQDYKTLCEDVHTASRLNMQHITALKYFPTFEIEEATELSDLIMRLVSSYNSLLSMKYNSQFHKMHHRNKENITETIPKKIRPLIQGIVD